MFALGIALISSINNYAIDLTHFLFGNILGVSSNDLILTAGMGALVLLLVLLLYKEFQLLSFDPILAATLRLPAQALETLLFILIAAAIVVSLQTVGVALVVAMLITPAATAYLLTKRLTSMMLVAVLIASLSGVVGLYLSYYLGIASGAAIVLTCTAVFIIVWAGQGLLARRPRAVTA
jgi:manganese/iron transport system permease protein